MRTRFFNRLLAAALVIGLFVVCESPFKAGLGSDVDVTRPEGNIPGYDITEEYFIHGRHTFTGIAYDDVSVQRVEVRIKEYGDSDFGPWVQVEYNAKTYEWKYTWDSATKPDGSPRPDKPIQLQYHVVDGSGKDLYSSDFVYITKNQPPETILLAPNVNFSAPGMTYPTLNPIFTIKPPPDPTIAKPESITTMTLVTGNDLVGQVSDAMGIALGYPKIKFWIGVDENGVEHGEPPDDDPRWGYFTAQIADDKDGLRSKEFRFPLTEYELDGNRHTVKDNDGAAKHATQNLSPLRRYRFKIKVQDVGFKEENGEIVQSEIYPLTGAGITSNPLAYDGTLPKDLDNDGHGYVELYLKALNEFPGFNLMDGSATPKVIVWGGTDTFKLTIPHDDADYPYKNADPTAIPYHYISEENSNINGPFILRVLASHSDGISYANISIQLEGETVPKKLLWDDAKKESDSTAGTSHSIPGPSGTPLMGKYYTYTFPRSPMLVPDPTKIPFYNLPNYLNPDGKTSFDRDATLNVGGLPPGNHRLIVEAVSNSGTERSILYSILIDKTPPKVNITRVQSLYAESTALLTTTAGTEEIPWYNINGNAKFTNVIVDNETGLRYSTGRPDQIWILTTESQLNYSMKFDRLLSAITYNANANANNNPTAISDNALAPGNGAAKAQGGFITGADTSFVIPTGGWTSSDWKLAYDPAMPLQMVPGNGVNSAIQWYLYVLARDEAGNVGARKALITIDQEKDLPEIRLAGTGLDIDVKTPKALKERAATGTNIFADGQASIPISLADDDGIDLGDPGPHGITIALLQEKDLIAKSIPTDKDYSPGGAETKQADVDALFKDSSHVLPESVIKELFPSTTYYRNGIAQIVDGKSIPLRDLAAIIPGSGSGALKDGYYYMEIRVKDRKEIKVHTPADDPSKEKAVRFWFAVNYSGPEFDEVTLRPRVNSYGSGTPPVFGEVTDENEVTDVWIWVPTADGAPAVLPSSNTNGAWVSLKTNPSSPYIYFKPVTGKNPDPATGLYTYEWKYDPASAPGYVESTATHKQMNLTITNTIRVAARDGLGKDTEYGWMVNIDDDPPKVEPSRSPEIVQKGDKKYVNGVLRFDVTVNDNQAIDSSIDAQGKTQMEIKYWFLKRTSDATPATPPAKGQFTVDTDKISDTSTSPRDGWKGVYLKSDTNPYVGYIDTRALADNGIYDLYIMARDVAGNINAPYLLESALIIDQSTDEPKVTYASPAAAERASALYVANTEGGLQISAILEDDDGIDPRTIEVNFSKNGGTAWEGFKSVTTANGFTNISISPSVADFTAKADYHQVEVRFTIPANLLPTLLGSDGEKAIRIRAKESALHKVGLRNSADNPYPDKIDETALIFDRGSVTLRYTSDTDANDLFPAVKFVIDSRAPVLVFQEEDGASVKADLYPLSGWLLESNPVKTAATDTPPNAPYIQYLGEKGTTHKIYLTGPRDWNYYDGLAEPAKTKLTAAVRSYLGISATPAVPLNAANWPGDCVYSWGIPVGEFRRNFKDAPTENPVGSGSFPAAKDNEVGNQGFYPLSIFADDLSGKNIVNSRGYHWDTLGPVISFTSIAAMDVFFRPGSSLLENNDTTEIKIPLSTDAAQKVVDINTKTLNSSANVVSSKDAAATLFIRGTLSDENSPVIPKPLVTGHVYFWYRFDAPEESSAAWTPVTTQNTSDQTVAHVKGNPGDKDVAWAIPLKDTNGDRLADGFHWVEIRGADALGNINTHQYDGANGTYFSPARNRKIGFRVDTAKPNFIRSSLDQSKGYNPAFPNPYYPGNASELTIPASGAVDPDLTSATAFIANPLGGIYHNEPATGTNGPGPHKTTDGGWRAPYDGYAGFYFNGNGSWSSAVQSDPHIFVLTGYLQEANLGEAAQIEKDQNLGVQIRLNGVLMSRTQMPLHIEAVAGDPNPDYPTLSQWTLAMPRSTFMSTSPIYVNEGTNELLIRIVDLNSNSVEMKWSFRKDTKKPTVNLTSLEGTSSVTSSTNPSVSGNVSDETPIAELKILVQREMRTSTTETWYSADASGNFSGTVGWIDQPSTLTGTSVQKFTLAMPSEKYPDGRYRIQVQARDSARAMGNNSGNAALGSDWDWDGSAWKTAWDTTPGSTQYNKENFRKSTSTSTMKSEASVLGNLFNGAIQPYYLGGTSGTSKAGTITAPANGGGGGLKFENVVSSGGDGFIVVKGTAFSTNEVTVVRARYNGARTTGYDNGDYLTFTQANNQPGLRHPDTAFTGNDATVLSQPNFTTPASGKYNENGYNVLSTDAHPDRASYLVPDTTYTSGGISGYNSTNNTFHYNWVLRVPLPQTNPTGSANEYTLYLEAEDTAGRFATTNGSFGLDNIRPVVKIDGPMSRDPKEKPISISSVKITGQTLEDNQVKAIYYQVGRTKGGKTFTDSDTKSTYNLTNLPPGFRDDWYILGGDPQKVGTAVLAKMTGNVWAWTLNIDAAVLFQKDGPTRKFVPTGNKTSPTAADGWFYLDEVSTSSKGTENNVPTDYTYLYSLPVRIMVEDQAGNLRIWDSRNQLNASTDVTSNSDYQQFPASGFNGFHSTPGTDLTSAQVGSYYGRSDIFTLWLDPEGDKPRAQITNPYPVSFNPDASASDFIVNSGGNVGGSIRLSGQAWDNDWVGQVAIRVRYVNPTTPYNISGKTVNLENGALDLNQIMGAEMPEIPGTSPEKAAISVDGSWYKATLVETGGGQRVNWYATLNGSHSALAPETGKTWRKIQVEVVAWDTEENHLTLRQTGSFYSMILDIGAGAPVFSDVEFKKPTDSNTPPTLGNPIPSANKVGGKFYLTANVRDDNGLSSLRISKGSAGVFTEILGNKAADPTAYAEPSSLVALSAATAGNTYLVYSLGNQSTNVNNARALYYYGAEVSAEDNADIKNTMFTYGIRTGATLPSTVDTGQIMLIEAQTDAAGKQYFEYTVQVLIDTTGPVLGLVKKAAVYPLTLRATDLTQPTALVTEYPVNVQVDNFAPMGEYTGNSRNVVGTDYYLQGRAWDIENGEASIGSIARVELYFERNGSLISVNENRGGAVPTGQYLPGEIYRGRYIDRKTDGTNMYVPGYTGSTSDYLYPNATSPTDRANAFIEISKTEGDKIFETNGSDKNWSARFDASRLKPGEVTLHYIIYDEAGNGTHYTQPLMIRDSGSISIRRVTLGTNVFNLSSPGVGNSEEMPVTTNYSTTKFTARNKFLSVKVEINTGNPGVLTLKLGYITGYQTAVRVTALVKDHFYKITSKGDTPWVSLGAPTGYEVGTIFKATGGGGPTGGALTGTGTAQEVITTDMGTASTPVTTLLGSQYTFTIPASKFGAGANDIKDAANNGALFLLDVKNDAGTDVSTDFLILGLNVANDDKTAPEGGRNLIYDFSPYASESLGVTAGLDVGSIYFTEPSIGGYPRTYNDTLNDNQKKPGIYLERSGGNDLKSGHVEPRLGNPQSGLTGATGFTLDTLSGKVILRGRAFDDQRIKEIAVQFGNDTEIVILKAVAAAPNAPTGHLVAASTTENVAVVDTLDLSGHRAEFAWVWDTQTRPVNTVVADNLKIQLIVRDFGSATTAAAAEKRVNLAPYITGFSRDTGSLSPAARSKFGYYSLARNGSGAAPASNGDTVTVQGFNLLSPLGATSMTIGTGTNSAVYASGGTPAPNFNAVRFTLPAAITGGLVDLKASGIQAVNSNAYTRNGDANGSGTVNPWNKENTLEGATDRWTDRRNVRIWQSNNTSAGDNRGYFDNSAMPIDPAMSVAPDGVLWGSWARYATVAVYEGKNNATVSYIRTHVDDFEKTDIHYSSSNRATTVYTFNGAWGTDYYIVERSGGVAVHDGNTISGNYADAYGNSDTGGNGTAQRFYAVERPWRSTVVPDIKLDRFGSPRVVTSGSNIHVSYYDTYDRSLKYWYNASGANWSNNQYRDNDGLRGPSSNGAAVAGYPSLLPRHWVNLDGGWNLYDNGHTAKTGTGSTAQGTAASKKATPTVRDAAGRSTSYNGEGTTVNAGAVSAVGLYHAIDVFNGIPVIAYYDEKGRCLKVITAKNTQPYTGDSWNAPVQITPTDSNTGQFVSIKVNGTTLHVVYFNAATSNVDYMRLSLDSGNAPAPSATYGGYSGPVVSVDSAGKTVGKWADITLDSSGNPYITYQDISQVGEYGVVKMAFIPSPSGDNWKESKNWEAMHAAIRFPGKDARLSVETKPGAANVFWKAAIGYASDAYRIAYYVE